VSGASQGYVRPTSHGQHIDPPDVDPPDTAPPNIAPL
jgi:hypothetical protein